MDILAILKSRIDSLPQGDYLLGLKSVLVHVEVSSKHLLRGQSTGDETAYTDAIYRTNQAFEGSLKEAYRVLAGKSPEHVRPFDIETFFETEGVLRPRVLALLTSYRKDWRNPSTHDYLLSFDDDEALLAIVSVCAFAIVLIDQIAERLSFELTKSETHGGETSPGLPLVDRFYELLKPFTIAFNKAHPSRDSAREATFIGALMGYLASAAPDISAEAESRLVPDVNQYADMRLASANEKILVEVKLARASPTNVDQAQQKVLSYMAISGCQKAVLLMFPIPNSGTLVRNERVESQGVIHVIAAEQ